MILPNSKHKVSEITGTYSAFGDSGICKFDGNKTLPMQYKGGIPSHFICTKCQIIQINENNPFLDDKITDPKEIGRRTESGLINTLSGNSEQSEQSTQGIKRKEINILDYETKDKIVDRSQDLSVTIEQSLNRSLIEQKQTERDNKMRLRDLFGRSISRYI